MKKRKMRRFQEGAYLDIDREPLRDSSGEIVRDSSGEPVMSGGSPDISDTSDIERFKRLAAARQQAPTPPPTPAPPRDQTGSGASPLDFTPSIRPPMTGLDVAPGMGSRKPIPPAKPAAKPPAKPASVSKPPAQPSRQAQAEANLKRLQEIDKPLERVSPELSLLGGPALRMLKGAGAAMASRLAPAKAVAEKYMGPAELAKKPNVLTRSPERNRRRLLTESKSGEPIEGAAEPLKSLPGRMPERNRRRLLTGDTGATNMRKGGKVSSASKRADGIAQRGKTRGKYI